VNNIYKALLVPGIIFLSCLLGHGLHIQRISGGTGIQVSYADDSPLAYGNFELLDPSGNLALKGMSDRTGNILFVPDTSGVWRLAVDDGMGHRIEEEINVGADLLPMAPMSSRHPYQDIVTGVSVIFGLAGLISLVTTHRKGRS